MFRICFGVSCEFLNNRSITEDYELAGVSGYFRMGRHFTIGSRTAELHMFAHLMLCSPVLSTHVGLLRHVGFC